MTHLNHKLSVDRACNLSFVKGSRGTKLFSRALGTCEGCRRKSETRLCSFARFDDGVGIGKIGGCVVIGFFVQGNGAFLHYGVNRTIFEGGRGDRFRGSRSRRSG